MTTIWSYNPTVEGWSLRWSWAESSQQKELIRTVPKIYISEVCLWEGGGSNTGVWYAKPLHHSGPLWHQTKRGVFLLQVFVWCQLPNQKKKIKNKKKIIVSLLKAARLLGMKASLPGLRFLKRLLESEIQPPRSLPSWFEWIIVRKENPSFPPAWLSPSSQLISIYSNPDRTPVMPAPQEGF